MTKLTNSQGNESESLGDSRVIVTNQPGIHEKLEEIVEKLSLIHI